MTPIAKTGYYLCLILNKLPRYPLQCEQIYNSILENWRETYLNFFFNKLFFNLRPYLGNIFLNFKKLHHFFNYMAVILATYEKITVIIY